VQMPETENLESVRDFVGKILNDGDMEALSEMVHRDILLPGSTPGLEGFKRVLLDQRKVFAEPEYKAVDVIAQGEKVAVRFAGNATHDGAFLGLPATGKRVKIWGVMIFRFEARMIAEFWSVLDVSSILRQLRER